MSFTANSGEYYHQLTIAELPSHDHGNRTYSGTKKDGKEWSNSSINNTHEGYIQTEKTGGNKAHNNIQPYQIVYYWKRIS